MEQDRLPGQHADTYRSFLKGGTIFALLAAIVLALLAIFVA